MAYRNSVEELERETEAERSNIGRKIEEIQRRLSPGELLDEALAYAKTEGGEMTSNFANAVKSNPLPIALLGVSVAWLIAESRRPDGHASGHDEVHRDYSARASYPPTATVTGDAMTYVETTTDNIGRRYAHFVDRSGKRFRAATDEMGRRTGHFMDDTGDSFSGFVDETGRRVENFRTQSGETISHAADWASHTWQDARDMMSYQGRRMADRAARLREPAEDMMHRVEENPLVAGALAFAAGAAIGALIPHTQQEDRLFGDVADQAKTRAAEKAEEIYEEGKRQAGHVAEETSRAAVEAFDDVKRSAGLSETDKSHH